MISTHLAREGNVAAAMEEIQHLPTVTGRSVRIRMLEGPEAGEGEAVA